MKQYDLTPEDPTYTALFNACSNSPWPADGLSHISNLRELMAQEDYSPNIITYNAMIKAYACCGDVKSAFAAVDEALAAGHTLNPATYSCLLMACIADKSLGLKLAVEVWFSNCMQHTQVLCVDGFCSLIVKQCYQVAKCWVIVCMWGAEAYDWVSMKQKPYLEWSCTSISKICLVWLISHCSCSLPAISSLCWCLFC